VAPLALVEQAKVPVPRRAPTGPPGPLTNTPVDRPGDERRPALVVKIDNLDPVARPQYGITLADVVYEEKVEGPISRFAAVFEGDDAPQIGPVRSARSTDVQIVGDLQDPLFAYSGANGGFLGLLATAPLIDVGAGHKGGAYWRGGDRPEPHNLYTSTASLYDGVAGHTPKPLWPFRGPNEPLGPASRPALGATYQFGGYMTVVDWRWDAGSRTYVRWQNGSVDIDGDNWPIAVSNLVLEEVPYHDSGEGDEFGDPIPEAELGGSGRGWILSAGSAEPVQWTRYALDEPTTYWDPTGKPVRFAPGRTWVALVPQQYAVQVRLASGATLN
jgi:hypothetical protein